MSPVNPGIFCVVVESGDQNYACWIWYHMNCSTGPYHNYLHWCFLFILLTKNCLQRFHVLSLPMPRHDSCFWYSYPWNTFYYKIGVLLIHCYVIDYTFLVRHWLPMPLIILTCVGGNSTSLILFRFLDQISGLAKYFQVGKDIRNHNHRDVVQYYPCC